jgi:hypothetical protein
MNEIPEDNELHLDILNGKPAKANDWPATLKFESAGGFCTSTIIGERVILTAAHCVPNQSKARVNFNNARSTVTCSHHPQYKGASCLTAASVQDIKGCTADIALCVADEPFRMTPPSGGAAIKFETINSDPALVKQGSPIVLLGYGCTMAGGPVSAILRIGDASVTSVSVPGASADPRNTMQEYIVAQGGGAVCQGDSGGAAFNTKTAQSRKVMAVNSRGNISTVSFLTSMSDPHINDFLKQWSGPPRNVQICGVTQNAQNCL